MPIAVRIHSSAQDEDALVALVDAGAAEVEAQGPDLLGLFHSAEGEACAALVRGLLPGATVSAEPAAMVDWDSVWVASLRPVRVGPLVVAPAGVPAPAGALEIETDGAFGSARHPSTMLCIRWLVDRPTAGTVLDVGTGSGVLALAALRLGASEAVGIDADPAALVVARRNARRAGLEDRLLLADRPPEGRRYDRVVANILASPLIELAPSLAGWLGPGGELAVSGFGPTMQAEVRAALLHAGLRVVGGDEVEGWCRVDAFAPW